LLDQHRIGICVIHTSTHLFLKNSTMQKKSRTNYKIITDRKVVQYKNPKSENQKSESYRAAFCAAPISTNHGNTHTHIFRNIFAPTPSNQSSASSGSRLETRFGMVAYARLHPGLPINQLRILRAMFLAKHRGCVQQILAPNGTIHAGTQAVARAYTANTNAALHVSLDATFQ